MRQPTVGDPPVYDLADDDVPWVLGTQLTEQSGPLARASAGSQVLMIESHGFARRLPYHHHKLTLVFAAMRRFRDRLREAGYDVTYIQAASFGEGLERFFSEHPEKRLVAMRSPSYGSGRRFDELVDEAGGDLRLVENELFVSTREAFDEFPEPLSGSIAGRAHRHQPFLGVLVEKPFQPLAERRRLEVGHVVARLAQAVAKATHRREDQRQLVVVVGQPPGEAVRLDHEYLTPRGRTGERPRLLGELRPEHPRHVVGSEVVHRRVADRRLSHTRR